VKPVKYTVRFTHYMAKPVLQDMGICSAQSVEISRDGGGKEIFDGQKGWKTERITCQEL
jgi:hypothetical protein